ncbi:unnamed protein product [Linum tenue]|uniref:DUF7894 domain-containing protein n=1 Tax=Linum tenue TaxID=586396 RepID=A0AAV0NLN7_9ROSI|nr:unnamed protein product [Linum tenue]
MKVASQIVLLFKDKDGFAAAISEGLNSNPSSGFRRLEESLELPLDGYGVKGQKACGDFVHFVDNQGNYEVSLLLLEKYEPPILACALNEVLANITKGASASLPAFIVPFTGASKLKWEPKALPPNKGQVKLYSILIGPGTNSSKITSRTEMAPASFHIQYEPLACFIHLARVLKLPTSVVFGHQASEDELQALYQIGDLLANITGLCFLKEKVSWNPMEMSKDSKEPWRALYG